MFCRKCGASLVDGSYFCDKCGTEVFGVSSAPQNHPSLSAKQAETRCAPNAVVTPHFTAHENKRNKKLGVFVIATILMVVVSMFVCVVIMQPKGTEEPQVGGCQETMESWLFDEVTGTLAIIGQGPMEEVIPEYNPDSVPWRNFSEKIKSVVINAGVTSVGAYAFYSCSSLQEVYMPKSLTRIAEHSFDGCRALSRIIIPQGVTSIGSNAFKGCINLSEVVLPESVTSIGDGAFYNCSFSEIIIPENVLSVGSAFSNCSKITKIELPEGVKDIENFAFYGCDSLKSITIPTSVTNIGSFVFDGCGNLRDIYFAGSKAQWDAIDLHEPIPTLVNIHYSLEEKPDYLQDSQIVEYEDLIKSPSSYLGELISIRGYVADAEEQITAANGYVFNRIFLLPSKVLKTWEDEPSTIYYGTSEMEGYIYYWLKTPFKDSCMINCADDTHSIDVESYRERYVVVTGIFKYEDNTASLELLYVE